ncbi:hypothetical protein A2U01_0004816 [Trifolium medium]|uniref:Uncharacterized protein n=1 Tax=Trifolium medium TaxID=97028 RepID=A0A392M973_9FABA|nr:hypothetical protein [Trifolium medium]
MAFKSINKTAGRMLQLGDAMAFKSINKTAGRMLFKTYVNYNEFQNADKDNRQIGNKAVKATLVQEDGEYVLKMTTVKTNSMTAAEQAETAATLFSQATLLRKLGEKLLLQSKFFKSLDV